MRILRFNNELTRWDTAAIDEVKRRTLDTKNYGLKFGPVSAEDSGTYLCLINNRREPDALLELTVEGKIQDWKSFQSQMFRSSHFSFLVTFGDEVMKIPKYYVIFAGPDGQEKINKQNTS